MDHSWEMETQTEEIFGEAQKERRWRRKRRIENSIKAHSEEEMFLDGTTKWRQIGHKLSLWGSFLVVLLLLLMIASHFVPGHKESNLRTAVKAPRTFSSQWETRSTSRVQSKDVVVKKNNESIKRQ